MKHNKTNVLPVDLVYGLKYLGKLELIYKFFLPVKKGVLKNMNALCTPCKRQPRLNQ